MSVIQLCRIFITPALLCSILSASFNIELVAAQTPTTSKPSSKLIRENLKGEIELSAISPPLETPVRAGSTITIDLTISYKSTKPGGAISINVYRTRPEPIAGGYTIAKRYFHKETKWLPSAGTMRFQHKLKAEEDFHVDVHYYRARSWWMKLIEEGMDSWDHASVKFQVADPQT